MLEIKNLHVEIGGNEILKGVNLTVPSGEIHAIMGENGSGKSTLASVLMGHPKYKITKGEILFENKNIAEFSPDERAKLGMFLSMQNPVEVEGVRLSNFLWQSAQSIEKVYGKSVIDFRKELKKRATSLRMPEAFVDRDINTNFSGGEKKKSEILQMATLKPKFAIIDEVDSGLDIDSLNTIAQEINNMREKSFSGLLITHYQRIFKHLKPDRIHVMIGGKIVKTGNRDLVKEIEEKGYSHFKGGNNG